MLFYFLDEPPTKLFHQAPLSKNVSAINYTSHLSGEKSLRMINSIYHKFIFLFTVFTQMISHFSFSGQLSGQQSGQLSGQLSD